MTRGRSPLAPLRLDLAVVFALALGFLAVPGHVVAAPADSSFTDDLLIYPPAPCTTDTVTLFVRGFVATPCDSFLSAEKIGATRVRVTTQAYSTRQCLVAPFQFYSVPVVMGRFAAGQSQITVERRLLVRDEIGRVDTTTTISVFGFDVFETCQLPEIPALRLPFVTGVATDPRPACPGPVTVRLDGVFPNGCGEVVSVDPATLSVVIAPYATVTSLCSPALEPWRADLPLGRLAAGHFQAAIHMTVLGSDDAWPPIPTQRYVGVFAFDVLMNCGGPEPLPYVDFIHIQPKGATDPNQTICPDDSVQVVMGGRFPSSCFHVDSLVVVPRIALPAHLPPPPPLIGLWISDQGCRRIACSGDSVPWQATLVVGPEPSGDRQMPFVEMRTVGCPPVTDSSATWAPFTVGLGGVCPSPVCDQLNVGWTEDPPIAMVMPQPGDGHCNAHLRPDGTASVLLTVGSPKALAGLQGTIHPGQGPIRITKLEPIGVAANMHFSWVGAVDGSAHFVMYDDHGAPIPASTTGIPVLRVTIAVAQSTPGGMFTIYTLWDMLGSTADGQGVPMCPPPPWVRMLPPTAVFCGEEGECDFNADGGLDVRDLVLMVRCINDHGTCPPDVGTRYDCNADSTFDLADVVCCAMELLRQPACPNCPSDSVRAAPEVAVGFDEPRAIDGGFEVPVRIAGSWSIGGARLRLRFPDDRFVVTDVQAGNAWIPLHQESGGELSIGLIHNGTVIPIVPERPLVVLVRLALRAGQSAGGEMRVEDGDFSGPDGVRLAVDVRTTSIALGSNVCELSPARPNPFQGSTQLSVRLSQSGSLDVGVYDLAGRRVATLYHGPASAGVHPLIWNGRTDDGAAAGRGIYFARAVANGHAVTRRLVMLSGQTVLSGQ